MICRQVDLRVLGNLGPASQTGILLAKPPALFSALEPPLCEDTLSLLCTVSPYISAPQPRASYVYPFCTLTQTTPKKKEQEGKYTALINHGLQATSRSCSRKP